MIQRWGCGILLACLCCISCHAQEALITWKNCILVPTDWADGDSFQIQTDEGELHTIRLYGADCVEWHVTDATDARRLRAQRRYFGIDGAHGGAEAAIQMAKGFGEAAAKEVADVLGKPFQVHTVLADAKGDGRHKRIYAFVTTASGEDLAERLIRLGLARAFGVYRANPAGKSAKDYEAYLKDVELLAAQRKAGIWAKTNWDLLPGEREAERRDNNDLALAIGGQKLRKGAKLNPNTAARDELIRLPGVGEAMANRIIENRPFRKAEDLRNVDGIGPKTLQQIRPFLDFSK